MDDLTKMLSIDINAPADRVWHELTKQGEICRPMYNCALHVQGGALTPGARLRYSNASGKNTFIVGEILEVDPPRRLVHTFRMTLNDDKPSTVTWELEPRGASTRVTVKHVFVEQTKNNAKIVKGWTEILSLFKHELENGSLPFKTRLQYGMMGAMTFMLPKATRTENAETLAVR
ncbi:MAG: SRPBCC domain-containing protein [Phycisphaerales bacterium]